MASQHTAISALEQSASDHPLQVLGTQKKVSFDETNLRETLQSTSSSRVTTEVETSSSQLGTSKAGETALEDAVLRPMSDDILSGRGAGVNLHPGNVHFRSLIQSYKQAYIQGDPGEKKRIIRKIVEITTKRGRFLKQDPETDMWQPITLEEARKKTGQALRENAPALKKRNDLKQKLQLVHQLKTVLPNYLSSRQETESPPMGSRPSAPMASSFASPIMSTNATHLLWSRMNVLKEKQEQLKRKQRELEDEQNELMQCFYQISASLTNPVPLTPMDLLFGAARSDSGSDSEVDQIYTHSQKKRRIIVS